MPSATSLLWHRSERSPDSGRSVGSSQEHPAPSTNTTRPPVGADMAARRLAGNLDIAFSWFILFGGILKRLLCTIRTSCGISATVSQGAVIMAIGRLPRVGVRPQSNTRYLRMLSGRDLKSKPGCPSDSLLRTLRVAVFVASRRQSLGVVEDLSASLATNGAGLPVSGVDGGKRKWVANEGNGTRSSGGCPRRCRLRQRLCAAEHAPVLGRRLRFRCRGKSDRCECSELPFRLIGHVACLWRRITAD